MQQHGGCFGGGDTVWILLLFLRQQAPSSRALPLFSLLAIPPHTLQLHACWKATQRPFRLEKLDHCHYSLLPWGFSSVRSSTPTHSYRYQWCTAAVCGAAGALCALSRHSCMDLFATRTVSLLSSQTTHCCWPPFSSPSFQLVATQHNTHPPLTPHTTQTQDPAARDALLAEVKKHFDEIAGLTKEHVTVSELLVLMLAFVPVLYAL